MESKFTPAGLEFLRSNDSSDHFANILEKCLSAVASNAGWAGMLPAAIAAKAVDTAIEFYNEIAELKNQVEQSL